MSVSLESLLSPYEQRPNDDDNHAVSVNTKTCAPEEGLTGDRQHQLRTWSQRDA